jgi:putative transposase
MAQKARFNLPGVPQHVIQRGNIREPCFFDDADYYRYLTIYMRLQLRIRLQYMPTA